MAIAKVYDGISAWDTYQMKAYDSTSPSTWIEKPHYYDGTDWICLGAGSGATVTVAATKNISNQNINATCSSFVKVDNDGKNYESDEVKSYTSYETYLTTTLH